MAGWNLALRFGLEVGAIAGLGAATFALLSSPVRWVGAMIVPLAAAGIWGAFNVLDDPSRSGAAPIEVDGSTRLAIELLILGGAAVAITFAAHRDIGIAFAVLVAVHYAASWSRVEWLVALDQASG